MENKNIEDISSEERWCSTDAFIAACTAASKILGATGRIQTIDEINAFQDLLKQQGFSILPISFQQRISELKKIIEVLGTTH
jgi:hypothetical protein